MKKNLYLVIVIFLIGTVSLFGQIDPRNSPYAGNGTYTVVMDSIMDVSTDVLIFRPSNSLLGPFPTVLFQPGANGFGSSYINKHSYDLYWEHLASYGFVVIIINNTAGGPNATLFTTTHDWIKDSVADNNHWMSDYVDLDRFVVSGHSNGGMNATDIIIDRPSEIDAIIYMASYPNPGMLGAGAQNVSGYTGKALLMCGDEDDTTVPLAGSTNDVAKTAYEDRFTNTDCNTWVFFGGVGHGGFGDYGNPDQPVGTIGRDSTTASVRHYLVSFMLTHFTADLLGTAEDNLYSAAKRPASVLEFETTCSNSTGVAENMTINEAGVSLYPNPTNDVLYINSNVNLNGAQVIVYDMIGSKVKSFEVLNSNTQIELNMSSLNSGSYFIHISKDNNVIGSLKFSKL